MPDATGLELIAHRVPEALGDDAVLGTGFPRGQATMLVEASRVNDVLRYLRDEDDEPYDFLASVHGCDYLPEEPRLGVHYQLLSIERGERINVKLRVGVGDPRVPSVVDL